MVSGRINFCRRRGFDFFPASWHLLPGMKIFRIVLILGFALYLFLEKDTLVSHGDKAPTTRASVNQWEESSPDNGAVPQKALRVLKIVLQTGHPPEGYVGGRTFQNREHRLPAGGEYREFDVDPHHGGRNAERLIIEWRTKQAWYTGDHYQTFIPCP